MFRFSFRHIVALIVGAVFDMVIAIGAAGYDSTHNEFSLNRGLQLFGGITNMLVLLGVVAVLIGLYISQRVLSQGGHHDAVPLITIVVVVVAGIVGLHWIHIGMAMVVPLVAVIYLIIQTAVLGRIFSR